ncbi:MAG: hypothetical protein M3P30_13215 [Chloroflexota bacterium]|nr:hypothetical protein [Chloroflexota bacterium]
MDRKTRLQLDLLREVGDLFRGARIRYWLRGGWALDFILGEVTRVHSDIDLVTWKRHELRVQRILQGRGFQMSPRGASTDFEKGGQEVNVLFIERGAGVVYTAGFKDEPRWSDAVLDDSPRRLAGLRCRAISPYGLLQEKENTTRWLGRPPR